MRSLFKLFAWCVLVFSVPSKSPSALIMVVVCELGVDCGVGFEVNCVVVMVVGVVAAVSLAVLAFSPLPASDSPGWSGCCCTVAGMSVVARLVVALLGGEVESKDGNDDDDFGVDELDALISDCWVVDCVSVAG